MKRLIVFLSVFLLISCNQTSESNVFNSDNLRGKYKVDLTPLIAETSQSEKADNKWEKMGRGLAAMAISSVKIEVNFYDNDRGVIHMDGGLIDFASALSDDPLEKTREFRYKVESDSVLFTKDKEGGVYEKWAIIKKYSESYDYIKLLIFKDGKSKYFFNLNKIN